jgi:hypothetical protein
MWTYGDGVRAVRAFWSPGGAGQAGTWVLADPATGNSQGVVPAGEFSRRFRPVDVFADVTGFPTYLGTVTASDGSALVDLVLDRNPFMLANGPSGRPGRTCSRCPAATATDGPRPHPRSCRLVRRR